MLLSLGDDIWLCLYWVSVLLLGVSTFGECDDCGLPSIKFYVNLIPWPALLVCSQNMPANELWERD